MAKRFTSRNIGITATLIWKELQPRKFYIMEESLIKLERFMMVQLQWIGWNKNKRGITITSANYFKLAYRGKIIM